ncbi:MAG TPA: beta-ketoacyl-[acyl-carrier-protein] synthase family protein [Polyangiaceae bacterium]|nr:beta-ketoacyl-[acyl-carrier-protein] synthase family protein [Polyangiaceae bacterium]
MSADDPTRSPPPTAAPARVLVTGLGVVSSIGLGRRAFFEALAEGKSGISRVESFDTTRIGRDYGGEVKAFHARDHLTAAETRRMGRCSAMALAAARMAVEDARIRPSHLGGPRTSVVLGTTMGEADVLGDIDRAWIARGVSAVRRAHLPKYGSTLLPIHLARAFGTEGAVIALPAACAAGNYAIGFGADLIRQGRADVVLAGATEILQELQYSGFARLAAMAHQRCQPFDLNRQGLIVGEGAAVLVLESEAHAVRRGATACAEVGGYGLTCDGYHITRPHPEAVGSIEAMRQAITRSGITPDAVDFVNAHGTGTRANDAAEAKVMREVFGGRRVPISSMKSLIGHCMGAASAIEAVGCVFTLENGLFPPTAGYETPDPECDLDVVANAARTAPGGVASVVLNNSLAFGGYNAVACFARPGVLPEPPTRAVL